MKRIAIKMMTWIGCGIAVFLLAGCSAKKEANKNAAPNYQTIVAAQMTGNPQPPEIAEINFPVSTSKFSPDAKRFGEETWRPMQLSGDETDSNKIRQSIKALGGIIGEKPDNADAHFMRALLSWHIGSTDYSQMLHDIDIAIANYSSQKDKSAFFSDAPFYGLRAKLDKAMGDYRQALADLEKAVSLEPDDPSEALCISGTQAEEISQGSVWNYKDFDEIMNKFPNDYRAHLFRGYYYSFFAGVNNKYYAVAIASYTKAIQLNSGSYLAYYLVGKLYEVGATQAFQTKHSTLSGYDMARDKMNKRMVSLMSKAIALNSQFKDAYVSRAHGNYFLGNYEETVKDCNKIVELDPNYGSGYDERGLAEVKLAKYSEAIDDFGKAIEREGTGRALSDSYYNRADAEIKVKEYDDAVSDYTKAIGIFLGRNILVMHLSAFRAIYPEYDNISDTLLAKMFWQKFYPDLSFESFMKEVLADKESGGEMDFLSDLFLARANAYLLVNHISKAAADFSRAANLLPYYVDAVGRWGFYAKDSDKEIYIDLKTVELSRRDTASAWIKTVSSSSSCLQDFAIDRASKKIRILSTLVFNSNGNVVNQIGAEKNWEQIVPGSFGEMLYKGFQE